MTRLTLSSLRWFLVLSTMLAAHGAVAQDGGKRAVTLRSEVLVEVESHNWNDVTVYLLTGGLPQRLGMVTALGNATFSFSSTRLNSSSVRLRALPVAGTSFTTDNILVLPGQAISWTLENDLDASSYTVY